MTRTNNIDHVQREMDLLWVGTDLFGRPPRPRPLVAVAIANDVQVVRFAPEIRPDMRRSFPIEDLTFTNNSQLPEQWERWRERLGSLSESNWRGGPSFVFDETVSKHVPDKSLHHVVDSDQGTVGVPLISRPRAWGDDAEWAELLAGGLGPWAIGMNGDRVAAVCYTPVASSFAAEARVWTVPEERGRGWAAAVTSAWARVAQRRFGSLFYSTDFRNTASQSVARKLQLRSIGTIWQLEVDRG